jgi:hypothetical protein
LNLKITSTETLGFLKYKSTFWYKILNNEWIEYSSPVHTRGIRTTLLSDLSPTSTPHATIIHNVIRLFFVKWTRWSLYYFDFTNPGPHPFNLSLWALYFMIVFQCRPSIHLQVDTSVCLSIIFVLRDGSMLIWWFFLFVWQYIYITKIKTDFINEKKKIFFLN